MWEYFVYSVAVNAVFVNIQDRNCISTIDDLKSVYLNDVGLSFSTRPCMKLWLYARPAVGIASLE